VVYVEAPAGKTSPPPPGAVIDQKGLMFQPHITAVQVGTTVQFLNSDNVPTMCLVFVGGNKKLTHNLGIGRRRQAPLQITIWRGAAAMQCPSRDGCYVVVSPTPYFAVTDKSGAYKIENVPDGSYTVTAWHEGAKNKTSQWLCGDTKADFALSK